MVKKQASKRYDIFLLVERAGHMGERVAVPLPSRAAIYQKYVIDPMFRYR